MTDHPERQLVQTLRLTALDGFVDDQPNHLRIDERRAEADDDEDRARQVDAALGPDQTRHMTDLGHHAEWTGGHG